MDADLRVHGGEMTEPKEPNSAARRRIMDNILICFQNNGDYPNAEDFRHAQEDSDLAIIDDLASEGVLRRDNGKYYFRLVDYVESEHWGRDEKIISTLFPKLRSIRQQYREKSFPIEILQNELPENTTSEDLTRVLIILERLNLIDGRMRDQNCPPNRYSTYSVPERIRYFKNVPEAIARARQEGHHEFVRKSKNTNSPASPASLFGSRLSWFGQSVDHAEYTLHQEVSQVSVQLYRNGHYAEAVEAGFKAVIARVKARLIAAGVDTGDGGDGMMGVAFACDKRVPPIRFNALSTQEELDEQRGIFFLFKGIVGIRNRKAHENVVLKDSHRAAEYIYLASLLMRLLDVSETLPASATKPLP